MSKTMDMLNEVAAKRMSNYTLVMEKRVPEKAPVLEDAPAGHITHSLNDWLTKVVLIVIIMVLLWSNFKFSTALKQSNLASHDSIAKLTSIEKILSENSQQMKLSNDNLKSLSLKLQSANEQIAEFKQQSDAQQFAISNLVKAKNTLYNQVNDLAAKLEAISSQEITKQ